MSTVDFLFEIGTEELPAKALLAFQNTLHQELSQSLEKASLPFESIEAFATPRRLALLVKGLTAKQADQTMERRGPAAVAAYDKEGNPSKAAMGFAASCKTTFDQLQTVSTDKGDYLAFTVHIAGQPVDALLPDMLAQAIKRLPIPKRMKWGAYTETFVRPVHWILARLDDKVLDCAFLNRKAIGHTYGHRIHSPEAIQIDNLSDYEAILKQHKVIASFEQRKQNIAHALTQVLEQQHAKPTIDEALLEEVTGLVEWPVALMGQFDARFLDLPAEAIIEVMASHQKYFPVVNHNGTLQARFVTFSNIESTNPQLVIAGNEKVIRPRLADAEFFYHQDRTQPLDAFLPKLHTIVYQKSLGTMAERVHRITDIAKEVAYALNMDQTKAVRCAALCKADLVSSMVYESPELQGIMGKYYANFHQEDADVAQGIEEHYYPIGADGDVASTAPGICTAIAEKMETLVGMFVINAIPTGDKDPFGVRRATIGILRTIIDNKLRINLEPLLAHCITCFSKQRPDIALRDSLLTELKDFIIARYRAWYQSQGIRADVVLAATATDALEPYNVELKVKALATFKQAHDIATLIELNKRIKNILSKNTHPLNGKVLNSLLEQSQEQTLAAHLEENQSTFNSLLEAGDLHRYLETLLRLEGAIADFFEHVMVNCDDLGVRCNRLNLLEKCTQTFDVVADFSKLQA